MASKYRSVIRAVVASPWAILPEKLGAIVELLNLRAGGVKLSQEEIAARIGTRSGANAGPQKSPQGVVVLNIFGTLMQHGGMIENASGGVSCDAIGAAFDSAMSDPNVGTIVLNIDSPGGQVSGTPELAAKIYAARGVKRCIAVANSLAASALYWIGSAAETFYASPSASVGSIGVLFVHTDDSKALEKQGIAETVISAGKYKAEGYGPLTEGAKTYIQDRVDYFYDQFVADVAKHRGASASRVKADYGQGRVLTAKDALAAGMIDGIKSFDQLMQELGVVAAARSRSADAPAFNLEGIEMKPELFGALVRVGMCPITATQAEAENAMLRFYAATNKPKPGDEDAQIKDIEAYIAGRGNVTSTAAAAPIVPVATTVAVGKPTDASSDNAADIIAAVRLAGIPDALDFAQALIGDKSLTLSAALKKIDAKAAELRKPAGTAIVGGVSERKKFETEAASAIVSRTYGHQAIDKVWSFRAADYVPFATNKNFSLQSLPRLAEESLIRDGFDANAVRRLSPAAIAQIALGVSRPETYGLAASEGPYNVTGTFANILLDAAHVTLRKSYDDAKTTFQQWMKRAADITDFKTINRVIAGELGDPRAVPEGAEFEQTTMTDGKESYSLRVWGQLFYLSYQAVVNDQLTAFVELPMKQGRAMKRKQNRLAYGVLKDNAAMADTGALFNSTAISTAGGHANLTTGAGTPTVANLNTLTQKMMEQKGLNVTDGSALNLMPRFLVTCPALRGTALQLVGSIADVSNSNANAKNIWQNALDVVVDAELGAAASGSDTAWYLAADSAEVDTIEYAFLQGMDSPIMDSQPEFDRLAIKYRIYQPFAVKAIDYRGLQKHAGA